MKWLHKFGAISKASKALGSSSSLVCLSTCVRCKSQSLIHSQDAMWYGLLNPE